VSTVGIIVVIHTNSSTSFTPSSQFEIYILESDSSTFEKISAIYQIDLEFKYLKPERFNKIFFPVNSPISL